MAGACPVAQAAVRPHALFSDHMVLQRGREVAVHGRADPGETVAVEFAGHTATTKADAAGLWRATLPALEASAEPRDVTLRGTDTVTIRDVLVGDVWLCTGQSNMAISAGHYSKVPEVKKDFAEAKLPLVRQFGVLEHFADVPQDDVKGEWLVCTPQMASRFTAVGFYFARELHAQTKVPIGIIRSAKGSTGIEMWLSQETLLSLPGDEKMAAQMRESLAAWERDKTAALQAGKKPGDPDFPPFPFSDKVRRPRCVTLHNGMIAPLAGHAIRGILWYQGEGNAGDGKASQQYAVRLRALIRDWRRIFDAPELPFFYVQLPAYQKPSDDPAGADPWARMREAQRSVRDVPHTGMAVTIDIGEADDIHPRNKADVGARLARLALRDVYGKSDPGAGGPSFREMKVEGDRARLFFDGVGSGLMVGRKEGRAPAAEDGGQPLQRFAVAGADRKWHWAEASIDGETVVVHATQVPAPVAVRYAFATNPEGANLFNRDGMPASPFRTDDW
jgi:sialate O-acetylesterase